MNSDDPPVTMPPPLPSPVPEAENSPTRVGQLTAQALQMDYESAAKAVEEMGNYLLTVQKNLDDIASANVGMLDEVRALAQHFREEGNKASDRVALWAAQTQRVRDTITALKANNGS